VPVRALDDWAEEVRLVRLDVLKIDVEGAEVAVLRGELMDQCSRHAIPPAV
jgi:FkbM family methyltransferase